MNTYLKILQTLINVDPIYPNFNFRTVEFGKLNEYWSEVRERGKDNNSRVVTEIYFFIQYILSCDETLTLNSIIKNKFKKIDNMRMSTIFKDTTEEVLEVIYKAQGIYKAFSSLARICRRKYTNNSIDTDLLLNPINENDRNVIKIYQSKSNYLFTIKDLINHIETSLSNTENYFAKPLEIKNPYNNLVFSYAILYNIYFKVRQSNYKMPMLFHNYFLCNFDMNNFKIENEYLIRDTYIKKIIYNSPTSVLFKQMKRMIETALDHSVRISKDVNKEGLITILRPYYYLHLVSSYHVEGTEKKRRALIIFNRKMNELYEYNPKFGRAYLKRQGINKNYSFVSDLDHPTFTMNEAMKYNHLFEDENSLDDSDDEEEIAPTPVEDIREVINSISRATSELSISSPTSPDGTLTNSMSRRMANIFQSATFNDTIDLWDMSGSTYTPRIWDTTTRYVQRFRPRNMPRSISGSSITSTVYVDEEETFRTPIISPAASVSSYDSDD